MKEIKESRPAPRDVNRCLLSHNRNIWGISFTLRVSKNLCNKLLVSVIFVKRTGFIARFVKVIGYDKQMEQPYVDNDRTVDQNLVILLGILCWIYTLCRGKEFVRCAVCNVIMWNRGLFDHIRYVATVRMRGSVFLVFVSHTFLHGFMLISTN